MLKGNVVLLVGEMKEMKYQSLLAMNIYQPGRDEQQQRQKPKRETGNWINSTVWWARIAECFLACQKN
jgi:hypothetical protein